MVWKLIRRFFIVTCVLYSRFTKPTNIIVEYVEVQNVDIMREHYQNHINTLMMPGYQIRNTAWFVIRLKKVKMDAKVVCLNWYKSCSHSLQLSAI